MEEGKSPASLEDYVRELGNRLKSLEERIEKVEKSMGLSKRKKKKKNFKSYDGNSGSNNSNNKDVDMNHNYLKKTIDDARKRYEREHKI